MTAGGEQIFRNLGSQVMWLTVARAISALLQLAIIILLARMLTPEKFAFASAALAILMVIIAINGFGIIRQIEYRRSLLPEDPVIPTLFTVRLQYSYYSGVLWILACAALWAKTGDTRFLILMPAAVWLILEQVIQVWNALSIVDGQAQQLILSFVARRLPMVLSLAVGAALGIDGLTCLVAGLVIGVVAAYGQGWFGQDRWARSLSPLMADRRSARVPIDIPFWFGQLGDQIRDLDVPVVALVSSATAGIYALPARLVRPMNLVTQAGGMVAFPHFVRRELVSRRELCSYLLVGSVPVVIASGSVYLAAPLLPMIVGDQYGSSVPVIRVLACAALLSGPAILLSAFLQARTSGALRDSGLIMLLGNLFLLPCVLFGTLAGGAFGAALGAVAGQAAILVALFARGLRECGVPARA